MMNLNKPTLVEFEAERIKNQYIPPEKSNSFYNIGNGMINLYTESHDPVSMKLSTYGGTVNIGKGEFIIYDPYEGFVNTVSSVLVIDGILEIKKDTEFHGKINITNGGILKVSNNITLTIYSDCELNIDDGASIVVEDGSLINMTGGKLNVHLNIVDSIMYHNCIYIDSSVAVNILGIDLGNRPYSMTDYELSLRSKIINIYTQGEYNSTTGRAGYKWTDGTPLSGSQCIELGLTRGEMILGDFKLSVLGKQQSVVNNLQVISGFTVYESTTLYISDNYQDYQYLRPELYLGIIAGNVDTPANCNVYGNIIVSGNESYITLDRNATLYIHESGKIKLINNGIIRATNVTNGTPILFIDGTLIIDDIEQLVGFNSDNIVFGEKGKIIILNPDRNDNRILFTTPNGIHESELYRLFENVIDHVEYHISNNTGIKIDQYYEYYNRDMTDWFGGRRIEKAIYDKILVWEDGGFIELNSDIIPWVNKNCTLFHAARLFKSYGSTDSEKLGEVADRLKYAGSGAIVFKFIDNDEISEVKLILDSANIISAVANTMENMYTVDVNNSGVLYMRNGISTVSDDIIINNESKIILVEPGENSFVLP